MKIKRYVVRNMHEAFEVIRRDLGPEAVIISSRKIRENGLWGFFAPKKLEVTAAVDNLALQKQKAQQDSETQELRREIAEMKALLHRMSQRKESEASEETNNSLVGKWQKILQDLDINKEIIQELLEGIEEQLNLSEEENDSLIQEALVSRMADLLEPDTPTEGNSRILAFIGPTGVGKTTTLAKLAAQFALFQRKRIGLITIDTYRIGAVEQLKTYAEILGVPVDVVMTPKELKAAVGKHQDKDVILIDTAGRPSKNTMQIQELRGFIEAIKPVETFLVLSCTTKDRDLLRIVDDFKVIDYHKLIFTKTDETETLGSIVNVAYTCKLPVAYITNGQNVPDDIEEANPQKLAKMILGAVG
ncbi:flagellar biosynthesis protein FlhF [Calderihabitans maritimus]|uniref:Flagellar biosynthesis protein FlhF n=1 Tax=Calderihabitans maritimus TaxID=1246530 RepID=A0A1Z5HUC9_9FIRM|nr:flagellar biosynthesis protein FlhF [Calderihabitans maritimus]GAW92935.1 GTP-binding signal recognition particle SRP54 G- domain protein [Calderihabitans maritimus]